MSPRTKSAPDSPLADESSAPPKEVRVEVLHRGRREFHSTTLVALEEALPEFGKRRYFFDVPLYLDAQERSGTQYLISVPGVAVQTITVNEGTVMVSGVESTDRSFLKAKKLLVSDSDEGDDEES